MYTILSYRIAHSHSHSHLHVCFSIGFAVWRDCMIRHKLSFISTEKCIYCNTRMRCIGTVSSMAKKCLDSSAFIGFIFMLFFFFFSSHSRSNKHFDINHLHSQPHRLGCTSLPSSTLWITYISNAQNSHFVNAFAEFERRKPTYHSYAVETNSVNKVYSSINFNEMCFQR